MANEYLVNSDDLTAVADAIRAKGGTSGTLAFPDGFVVAVGAIQAGSGGSDDVIKGMIDGTLVSISLPSGLTSIRANAFVSFSSLEDIGEIPDTVTAIGNSAFAYCGKLAMPELPQSVTSIGDSAFRECVLLDWSSLPEGITRINQYAFRGCKKLALQALPEGVTGTIDQYSFQDCTALKITKIPEGVTSLGNCAFQSCHSITSLLIPGGISINTNSCANCSSLTDVTFTGKAGYLGGSSFANCNNLLTINVPWAEGEVGNAPWGASNATINYNYTGEV